MPVIAFKEKNINCKSRTLWLDTSQDDIKNTNIGEQCLETSNTNMENQNSFMKC